MSIATAAVPVALGFVTAQIRRISRFFELLSLPRRPICLGLKNVGCEACQEKLVKGFGEHLNSLVVGKI